VAPEQTILMTVIPRGITVDEDTLPVSVFVTPRLRGALHLGAFRDWQLWTRRLADDGLTLTMRCGSSTVDIAVDQASLEPAFWEGLFNERTLVRSHEFDDYTGRAIFSFSVRRTLSVLKAIYQEAAVALALPDRPGEEHERGNRRTLRDLLDGLDVHWNPDLGERWRTQLRAGQRYRRFGRLSGPIPADTDLDGEGLLTAPRTSAMSSAVAIPFPSFTTCRFPTAASTRSSRIGTHISTFTRRSRRSTRIPAFSAPWASSSTWSCRPISCRSRSSTRRFRSRG
jgi:hypothetical protein